MDKEWYKPSEIARLRLITTPTGSTNDTTNYRYIVAQIKSGELKAKVWTHQGKNTDGAEQKPYYLVHRDEIARFNSM